MVLTAKVFLVKDRIALDEIALKLKDYRSLDTFKLEEKEIELLTEFKDLELKGDTLTGTLSKDRVIKVNQRGRLVPVLKTVDVPLLFNSYKDKVLLTVIQEKHVANAVATALSQILFMSYKSIVEAYIPDNNMRRFHEENPEATKLIWFDSIDIPSINKVAIAGEALKDSALYEEYTKHGKIWYMVYTAKDKGAVIGITRNCVITAFTKIPESDFIHYIRSHVFPLIE